MKKIHVFIRYRNYKPIHQIFQSLVETGPDSIEYHLPRVKAKPKIAFKVYRRFGENRIVKRLIGIFQRFYLETGTGNAKPDLVHIVDMIPTNYENYNYVVDIGHIDSLVGFVAVNDEESKKITKFLVSKKCKKIIARTKASALSITHFLEKFTEANVQKVVETKVQVVYPAIKPAIDTIKEKSSTDKDFLNVLCVGEKPYNKGIHELIEAYKILKSKNVAIKLKVISNHWEELEDKYIQEDIEFFKAEFTKTEIIERFFKPADVFVLPSHSDIFGMVHLDAFSTGTPVIALDQYSTGEIVNNGHNGFLLKTKRKPLDEFHFPPRAAFQPNNFKDPEQAVVSQIVDKLTILAKDKTKLSKLKKNALEEVKSGKFSIDTRNKAILKIYKKAIE